MSAAQFKSQDPNDTYLTTRQAAYLLNVSLRTIQLWCNTKVINAFKTSGGHRRILKSEVIRAADQMGASLVRAGAMKTPRKTVLLIARSREQASMWTEGLANLKLTECDAVVTNDIFLGIHELSHFRHSLLIVTHDHPHADVTKMLTSLRLNNALFSPVLTIAEHVFTHSATSGQDNQVTENYVFADSKDYDAVKAMQLWIKENI